MLLLSVHMYSVGYIIQMETTEWIVACTNARPEQKRFLLEKVAMYLPDGFSVSTEHYDDVNGKKQYTLHVEGWRLQQCS